MRRRPTETIKNPISSKSSAFSRAMICSRASNWNYSRAGGRDIRAYPLAQSLERRPAPTSTIGLVVAEIGWAANRSKASADYHQFRVGLSLAHSETAPEGEGSRSRRL